MPFKHSKILSQGIKIDLPVSGKSLKYSTAPSTLICLCLFLFELGGKNLKSSTSNSQKTFLNFDPFVVMCSATNLYDLKITFCMYFKDKHVQPRNQYMERYLPVLDHPVVL